jgi:hypothetical protein
MVTGMRWNPIIYDGISLESIMGGVRGLSITPSINGHLLDDYTTVVCEEAGESSYTPIPLTEGSVFCSYLLLYPLPDRILVKIGSSDKDNCVARMFQQAPVVAVVSELVYGLSTLGDREGSDEMVAEELKRRLRGGEVTVVTRISSEDVVRAWKHVVSTSLDLDNVLNLGFKLAATASRTLRNVGQTLLPSPGYAWFTSIGALGEHDMGVIREYAYRRLNAKRVCDGKRRLKIRHLPNGLFHVFIEGERNLRGEPLGRLLTYNDLRRLKLRVEEGERE